MACAYNKTYQHKSNQQNLKKTGKTCYKKKSNTIGKITSHKLLAHIWCEGTTCRTFWYQSIKKMGLKDDSET